MNGPFPKWLTFYLLFLLFFSLSFFVLFGYVEDLELYGHSNAWTFASKTAKECCDERIRGVRFKYCKKRTTRMLSGSRT